MRMAKDTQNRKWIFTKHENGKWLIDRDGYIWVDRQRQHRLVWETYYGKIPKGLQIHHIDGNKQNNAIENLQLVDAKLHKKIHSGCELRDGVWFKPCHDCGEFKNEKTEYYYLKKQVYSVCKICWNNKVDARIERIRADILKDCPPDSVIMFVNGKLNDFNDGNYYVTSKFERALFYSGGKKIDGVWWKPCSVCKRFLRMDDDNFYRRTAGSGGYEERCKECNREYKRIWNKKKAKKYSNLPDTIPIGGT